MSPSRCQGTPLLNGRILNLSINLVLNFQHIHPVSHTGEGGKEPEKNCQVGVRCVHSMMVKPDGWQGHSCRLCYGQKLDAQRLWVDTGYPDGLGAGE